MLHTNPASKPNSLALAVSLLILLLCPAAKAQNSASAAQPSAAATVGGGSNREQDGLLGPVRRVRTEMAIVSSKDGKLVESPRVQLETTTYDLRGNRTDNTYYAVAGSSLTGKEIYKYDAKGNIIEMTVRDADGSIINQEIYSYEFDAIGNWTKMTTSVAVVEGGKLTYEPTEVTYRTIAYYRTDAVVRMIASTMLTPTATPDANGAPRQVTDAAAQTGSGGNQASSSPVATLRNVAGDTNRPSPSAPANVARSASPPSANPSGVDKTTGATPDAKQESERPVARLVEAPTTTDAPDAPSTSETPSDSRINPKAIRLPVPVYPEFARNAGVRGMVRVEVEIDEEGKVTSARALSGPAQLHQAAVNAALRAQFSPATRAGKPVKINGVIGYNFVAAP